MSSDDEFTPTESAEEAGGEKFLNRKTGAIAPKAVVKTLLLIGITIGFAVGYVVSSVALAGLSCGTSQITDITSNPGSVDGSENITDNLKSDFISCTKNSLFGPVPIVAGLVGGAVLAYPSYKLTKSLSSGNYLRSLI